MGIIDLLITVSVIILLMVALAFYVSYKSHKKAYIQEDEPLLKHFLDAKQKTIFIPSDELAQNVALNFYAQKIFNVEQERIFDFLYSHLPLTHVHVLSHCALASFLNIENASDDFVTFYHQLYVDFLIIGKKSKTALMVIDYMSHDNHKEMSSMIKKMILQRLKIPYIRVNRELFIQGDDFNYILLQEWIKTHIVERFKI